MQQSPDHRRQQPPAAAIERERRASNSGPASSGPQKAAAKSLQQNTTRRRRFAGAVIAAGIVLAALGWGWHGLSGTASDDLTPQQIEEMNASWAAATANGVSVAAVAPMDLKKALGTMQLSPDQAGTLERDVKSGKVELVWLTVWDDMAEDGDTVALSSEGIRTVVKLKNAHVTIALPRPAAGVINMEGVYDGGGGITVGIMSGSAPVEVSPMQTGQVIGIPIR